MDSDRSSASFDEQAKSTFSLMGLSWPHQSIEGEASQSFSFPKSTALLPASSRPQTPLPASFSSLFRNKQPSTHPERTEASSSQKKQQHTPSPSSSVSITPRLPLSPSSFSIPSSIYTASKKETTSSAWESRPSQLSKPTLTGPSKRLGTGQPVIVKTSGSSPNELVVFAERRRQDSGSSSSDTQRRERSPSRGLTGEGQGGFADFASSTSRRSLSRPSEVGGDLDRESKAAAAGSSRGSSFEPVSATADDPAQSRSPSTENEMFGRQSSTSNTKSAQPSPFSLQQPLTSIQKQSTFLDGLPRGPPVIAMSKRVPSDPSLAIPPFAGKTTATSASTSKSSSSPPHRTTAAAADTGSSKFHSSRRGSSSSSSMGDGNADAGGLRKLSPVNEHGGGESYSRGEGGGSGGKKRRRSEAEHPGEENSARLSRLSVLSSIEETYKDLEEKGRIICRLRYEITDHEKKRKELDGQLAGAKKIAQASRTKFNEIGDAVTFLTAAKEAVDDQRRKLETEVESLRSLLNEATSQEPHVNSETDRIAKQRRTLEDIIHPLGKERDQAILGAQRSELSLELLKKDLEGKERDLKSKTERVRSLESDVDAKVETIRSLASDISKSASGERARLEIEKLQSELVSLEESAEASQKKVKDFEALRKSEAKERDELRRRVSDLEKTLREKEGALDLLKKDFAKEKELIKAGGKPITDLKFQLSTTKTDLQGAQDDVRKERGLLHAETALLEEARSQLGEAKGELGETKKELGESKKKMKSLGTALMETEERVAVVVNAKKNLEKSHANLETTVQNMRANQRSSSDQIAQTIGEPQKGEVEIQALKRDLQASNHAKDDAAADLKLAKTQISNLEKCLGSATSTISATRAEATALETKQTYLRDQAEASATELEGLREMIKAGEVKRASILERYISGEADAEEVAMVEGISKAVEESQDTAQRETLKELQTKLDSLEKVRRELAVKLAKANAGRSGSMIRSVEAEQSSPEVHKSDERSQDANRPPSPCPADSDAGSSQFAGLNPVDKAARHSSQLEQYPFSSQSRIKSAAQPVEPAVEEEEDDPLSAPIDEQTFVSDRKKKKKSQNDASSSDDDVEIISHSTQSQSQKHKKTASSSLSSLRHQVKAATSREAPIEIGSSSPIPVPPAALPEALAQADAQMEEQRTGPDVGGGASKRTKSGRRTGSTSGLGTGERAGVGAEERKKRAAPVASAGTEEPRAEEEEEDAARPSSKRLRKGTRVAPAAHVAAFELRAGSERRQGK